MRIRVACLLAVSLIALWIGGCVPSLNALYTDDTAIEDPQLLGDWVDKENRTIVAFAKGQGKAYTLAHTSPEWPHANFIVYVVELGGSKFLDVYPNVKAEENPMREVHLIPAHTFCKYWIDKNGLHLAPLSPDWLRDKIEKKEVDLPHQMVENTLLLTAPTDKLQAFVKKYAGDKDAFGEGAGDNLKRRKQ